MDLQFKIGNGHKVYPVLFDEAVYISPEVVDYHMDITREGYRDVLTFEVEADCQKEELAQSIVKAVSALMPVEDGIAEDLVAEPRVKLVPPNHKDYAIKVKKIRDLRENFD